MICIIALVVFSILGIFSASHRKIAIKAFDCVFRRMTLRPCQSGLDRQLKTGIIGFVSRKNVKAARFIAKHFELISWFFTILMFGSMFFTAQGFYNYVRYGNCNGPNSNIFCIFDALNPKGGNSSNVCSDPAVGHKNFSNYPKVDLNDPTLGSENAKVTMIEFGCFSCPYTKKAEPTVKQVLKAYDGTIKFVYKDFPLPNHEGSRDMALAASCALEQDKYWAYHDRLFELQETGFTNETLILEAGSYSMNTTKFRECLETGKYASTVDSDFEQGIAAGLQGTPTFFINNKTIVGPQDFSEFRKIIDSELNK